MFWESGEISYCTCNIGIMTVRIKLTVKKYVFDFDGRNQQKFTNLNRKPVVETQQKSTDNETTNFGQANQQHNIHKQTAQTDSNNKSIKQKERQEFLREKPPLSIRSKNHGTVVYQNLH